MPITFLQQLIRALDPSAMPDDLFAVLLGQTEGNWVWASVPQVLHVAHNTPTACDRICPIKEPRITAKSNPRTGKVSVCLDGHCMSDAMSDRQYRRLCKIAETQLKRLRQEAKDKGFQHGRRRVRNYIVNIMEQEKDSART